MAKRVAIVSDSAPPYGGGGVASAHYSLLRGFQRQGLEVALFTFYDRQFPETPESDIFRFGPPRLAAKLLMRLNGWIFSLLQPGRNAWYTLDTLISGLGARRMAAALAAWQPDVVIFPDHGAPARVIRKMPGTRWGLIAHHNPLRFQNDPRLGDFSAPDARLALWLEQQTISRFDRVACPSNHMRDWFDRTYTFAGPVAVIPNIPDVQSVAAAAPRDPRPEIGLPPDAPLLVIPSGEVRLKGTDFIAPFLKALAYGHSQPFGVCIASGLAPGLADDLASLPEHVRLYLPGRLAHAEYLGILKSASFGVFPSLIDNYSMALVEATLAGVPMLAFDAGGNADIVREGENGRLIPAFDVEALAAAGLDLLNNPTELATLRARTAAYRPASFEPQAVAADYVRFFIEEIAA